MTPVIGDLIQSTVGKVVGKLVEHYLPASMSEEDKAKFKQEADRLSLEEYKTTIESMQAINETMRAEAKSDHWLQWSWRPLVGITFSMTIINNYILLPYFAGYGLQPIDIPQGVWSAMLVVLGVAAGTRGWEKAQRATK